MRTRGASAWILGCGLLAVLVLLSSGCASPRPHPQAQTISIEEFGQRLRPYAKSGQADLPPDVASAIIRIPAGTRLPLHFDAQTPFLHTEPAATPTMLVFDRPVFFYPAGALISCDGCTWRRIDKLGTGSIRFGLAVTEEGTGPEAHFGVTLDDGPPAATAGAAPSAGRR